MKKVLLFPGQGAQHRGMGAELFGRHAAVLRQADDVLGYSVERLCVEDPHEQLSQTTYTQPALYVVNALSCLDRPALGADASFAAGHSLGEYNALLAAGAFDFVTGLRLVQKRGELMGRARGGGMAAVVGLSEKTVEHVLRSEGLVGLDLANLNTPAQVVISGPSSEIERAEAPMRAAGAKHFVILRVSAAFHSRYMREAEREFREFLRSFRFAPLRFPVLANVTARIYDPRAIPETLSAQISSPVRWTELIRRLMSFPDVEFEELGPGNVLTSLVRQIRKDSAPLDWPEEETARAVSRGEPEHSPAANEGAPPLGALERRRVGPRTVLRPNACLCAEGLGSSGFRRAFGVRYAYLAGAMYRGIASEELVVAMSRAGFMSFFGAGGLSPQRVAQAIRTLRSELGPRGTFGMNLLHDLNRPENEEAIVDLYLESDVRVVEASAFMQMTPALVRYRVSGLRTLPDGTIEPEHRVVAKLSRPEVAQAFLAPAPERILEQLFRAGSITEQELKLARLIPMADAITVESDSGGHTDQGVALTLLPTIIGMKDDAVRKLGGRPLYVGAAGGLGTPHAIAAALVMGADYVMTGSINQCTVESGTSPAVKDLLQEVGVQDTTTAPAGDMFELGARVQVLRRGSFFPARANKLYELYKRHDNLDSLDEQTRHQLETKFFKRSLEQVYEETKAYFQPWAPDVIGRAEVNPKHKMALVFRWYFGYSARLAAEGDPAKVIDYQVHCGPAMGAFNAWVKGTEWESWRHRRVAEVALKLMHETAELLDARYARWLPERASRAASNGGHEDGFDASIAQSAS